MTGSASQTPPHACRHPALTGAASHHRAKINFPAICLLQTGIAVVRNIDISLKIGESVIVWSHSYSPIPFIISIPKCVCVYMLSRFSHMWLCDPLDGFSWGGLPFLPPGDLPDPGSEPASPDSPVVQVDYLSLSTTWKVPYPNVYPSLIFCFRKDQVLCALIATAFDLIMTAM